MNSLLTLASNILNSHIHHPPRAFSSSASTFFFCSFSFYSLPGVLWFGKQTHCGTIQAHLLYSSLEGEGSTSNAVRHDGRLALRGRINHFNICSLESDAELGVNTQLVAWLRENTTSPSSSPPPPLLSTPPREWREKF